MINPMPTYCLYRYPNGAGCNIQCTYGFPNGHACYCKIHAPEGCVNVKDVYALLIARGRIKYEDQ